ncbi:MAG: OmpH family outer membrane protein [Solirubrobacteraceae bacterium]
MKIKSIILAAFLFSGLFLNAQKVAHIDAEKLLSLMPEKNAVEKTLIDETNKHKIAIENMQKEFQTVYTKYEQEASKVTAEVNQKRGKELQDKQKKVSDYQQIASKEIAKKEEELNKPILQKAQNAINEIAKEKGYDYVLLSNSLVVANGPDLIEAVKVKLGIK